MRSDRQVISGLGPPYGTPADRWPWSLRLRNRREKQAAQLSEPRTQLLDDRFHEICVVEQAELAERTACWRIPRLRLAKRGAVSWQDGGERSNWQ